MKIENLKQFSAEGTEIATHWAPVGAKKVHYFQNNC